MVCHVPTAVRPLGKALRLGVLLGSTTIPRWVRLALERSIHAGDAVLVVALVDGSRAQGAADVLQDGRRAAHACYRAVSVIDRAVFARGADAWDGVDAGPLLVGVPTLHVARAEGGLTANVRGARGDVARADGGLPADARRALEDADLDVIVRLGWGDLPGNVASLARHGVWSHAFGARDEAREGPRDGAPDGASDGVRDGAPDAAAPPCGWREVLEGRVLTSARLLASRADGPTVTLCETHVRTYRYSFGQNRAAVAWTAASFLPRELVRTRAMGGAAHPAQAAHDPNPASPAHHAPPAHAEPPEPPAPRRPRPARFEAPPHDAFLPVAPSVRASLSLLTRQAARAAGRMALDLVSRPQWSLHVFRGDAADAPIPELDAAQREIVPPRDRFWADPCLVEHDGRHYLFVEEEIAAVGRGRIAVLELSDDGAVTPPRTVVETDHHLSYPFVFRWQGETYMVPESEAAKRVDLFRATAFPHAWERVATLLDGVRASDATLLWRDDRWWMFAAVAENRGAPKDAELFLFHSERLTDGWQPHPRNPIVSDVRNARPAGALFEADGKLYRPSQDCSVRYGYGLNLNLVEELSPTTYRERLVASSHGDGVEGVIGRHTLSRLPGVAVTDALRRRRRGP